MTVFLCLIQGFLSLFSIIRVMQLSTSNPLTLILFAGLCFIFYQFSKNSVACRIRVSDQWCSLIIAFIFSLLTLLARYDYIVLNSSYFFERIVITILTGIGLLLLYFYGLLALFIITAELDWNRNLYPVHALPVITFLGNLILSTIYLLCEYPCVLTSTTKQQLQEIHGELAFSDNPSLVYTALIDKLNKLFLSIFHNETTSLALITFLQIIVISFVAGYVVKTLQKAHIHSSLCILAFIFYLLPYNQMMAVTLSSDVLFAANLVGYICVITRLLLKSTQSDYSKAKWFSIILPYFIFGFMVCTLSRNGLVCFLISLPFILIVLIEKWKVTVPVTLVILALVAFIKFPFMSIYEIEKPTYASLVSPTLISIFTGNSDVALSKLLKQYAVETMQIWFPQAKALSVSSAYNDSAIINMPAIIKDTILTMQVCIPLYGLLWSPGLMLWILIISIFTCGRNEKHENIPMLLPVFIFMLSLLILAPATLTFAHVYPVFFVLPLVFLMPFIDSESEY